MWLLISCSGNHRERSLVAMATAEAWRWKPGTLFRFKQEWKHGGGLAYHNARKRRYLSIILLLDRRVHVFFLFRWKYFRSIFGEKEFAPRGAAKPGVGKRFSVEGKKALGSKAFKQFSIILNSIETKPRKTEKKWKLRLVMWGNVNLRLPLSWGHCGKFTK